MIFCPSCEPEKAGRGWMPLPCVECAARIEKAIADAEAGRVKTMAEVDPTI